MAEAAPEFEILSVCGLECLPQRADLVAVPAFELGELGGEGCGSRCTAGPGQMLARLP